VHGLISHFKLSVTASMASPVFMSTRLPDPSDAYPADLDASSSMSYLRVRFPTSPLAREHGEYSLYKDRHGTRALSGLYRAMPWL